MSLASDALSTDAAAHESLLLSCPGQPAPGKGVEVCKYVFQVQLRCWGTAVMVEDRRADAAPAWRPWGLLPTPLLQVNSMVFQ